MIFSDSDIIGIIVVILVLLAGVFGRKKKHNNEDDVQKEPAHTKVERVVDQDLDSWLNSIITKQKMIKEEANAEKKEEEEAMEVSQKSRRSFEIEHVPFDEGEKAVVVEHKNAQLSVNDEKNTQNNGLKQRIKNNIKDVIIYSEILSPKFREF